MSFTLSMLIEPYCVHLEAEGRSPEMLQWHRTSLAKFSDWLTETGTSEKPDDWTANTIRAYYVALKHTKKRDGSPLSTTSFNTYACSLRAFCQWLRIEEFTERTRWNE